MKQSKWLMDYERQVKELQEKSKSGKNAGIIVVFIMFAVMLAIGLSSGSSGEFKTYLPFIAVPLVIIILLFAILGKKSASKDVAAGVRKQLAELLTTDELVEEFDRQMAEPVYTFRISDVPFDELIVTDTYLVKKFDDMGMVRYSIVKLSDIRSEKHAASINSTGRVKHKSYFVDLLNVEGRKIMGFTVEGDKKLEEFFDIIERICPEFKR